jgi:phosphate uptake regulator
MERRKVTKIGPSSLCVSLPKAWTNRLNIKASDFVHLVLENESAITIIPAVHPRKYKIQIDVDKIGPSNRVARLLVATYMMGATTVKLISFKRFTNQEMRTLRNTIHSLIGSTILQETEKEVIIEIFLDSSKLDLCSLLTNQSLVTSTMLKESLQALLNPDPTLAEASINRENKVDSLYYLISRLTLFTRARNEMGVSPLLIRLISKSLERIADCSEYIARYARELYTRKAVNHLQMATLNEMAHAVLTLFNKAIESITNLNDISVDSALDVLDMRRDVDMSLWKEIRDLDVPYYQAIISLFEMITENSANVASEALNIGVTNSTNFLSSI